MLNNILILGLSNYIGIMNIMLFHGRSVTEITEGVLFLENIYSIYKIRIMIQIYMDTYMLLLNHACIIFMLKLYFDLTIFYML